MSNVARPPAAKPKAIFIVEDHPAFREGLRQIIANEKDLAVCGQAKTAEQALPAINRLKPDLVLVDITLPGKSGLKLIRDLRKAGSKAKLLVISIHDEALYADRVLRAGGDGYIMKQADPQEIINAIRDVLSGHLYVSEDVLEDRHGAASRQSTEEHPLDALNDEELEILEMLGAGKSDREIASQLKLTAAKLSKACKRMKRQLKLKSTNALIRYGVCWIESNRE